MTVILTRRRVIEEKIVTEVSALESSDAIAVSNHLTESGVSHWKYSRTLETSLPCVDVRPGRR